MLNAAPVIYYRVVKGFPLAIAMAAASLAFACSTPVSPAAPSPSVQSAPLYVANADCDDLPRLDLPITALEITDGAIRRSLSVEVADTPQERSQGLMCRATVAPGSGMLFVPMAPTSGGFWMYNTYVDLDVLYLSAGGQVRAARTMAPCPRAAAEEESAWTSRCIELARPYAPGLSYSFALELPAGWLVDQGFDPDPTRLTVEGLPAR